MNTSSRMMSFGQEQNVHVSGAVKALLPASYTVKERGKVTVKGKGEMTTFWVESKANRSVKPYTEPCCLTLSQSLGAVIKFRVR